MKNTNRASPPGRNYYIYNQGGGGRADYAHQINSHALKFVTFRWLYISAGHLIKFLPKTGGSKMLSSFHDGC